MSWTAGSTAAGRTWSWGDVVTGMSTTASNNGDASNIRAACQQQ